LRSIPDEEGRVVAEGLKTPKDVLALCRARDVRFVDYRFTDLSGTWRHVTVPVTELTEESFEDGYSFDGSSSRRPFPLEDSDLLMVPDPTTAFLDPFCQLPTLVLTCNVQDPVTRADCTRDPRHVARKSVQFLVSSGLADRACIGPETEFFVFDDVRFDSTPESSFYTLDSVEAVWNRGRDERPNLGHKLRSRDGYLPCPPSDQLLDVRNDMVQTLIECGVRVEAHHHEGATPGQCVIDMKYQELVRMADQAMIYKYVVKNVARKYGKSATFMPKPVFGEQGSGMHTHFSLWRGREPLFAGNDYAGLSEMALHALGGILRHTPAIMAFSNPTTNSYRRFVHGLKAPLTLSYSQRNRSAAVRIPLEGTGPETRRLEFRCPDPMANPYLAFAALLMAAVDGIHEKISPGDPSEGASDGPSGGGAASDRPRLPNSLSASLDALASDQEFLLRNDCFTPDVLDTWIELKRREVEELQQWPHPHEFSLYYDG
jgi:glutamine synthetase